MGSEGNFRAVQVKLEQKQNNTVSFSQHKNATRPFM